MTADGAATPLLFLVAGEPSGDALGAGLMRALRERLGGRVRFAGVGGEQMAAEGLQSIFPIADIAVMGVAEVVPRLRLIRRRIAETVAAALAAAPAAVITIDSFGFNGRVGRGLRARGARVPLIHYAAPTVWVWRPKRAAFLARYYDHVMTLLPFEPPYFAAVGLAATHVGHPVLERGADRAGGAAFRAAHQIPPDRRVIALMPGSRHGEVKTLLPVLRQVAERLRQREPSLAFVLPTVAAVAAEVTAAVAQWPMPVLVTQGETENYAAMAASNLAIAASGTVTVELALAQVPMVVTHRVHWLTAFLLRRVSRVRFVSLVNLFLDRGAIPELLQEDCTPDRLVAEAVRLLEDRHAREQQQADCREALARLGRGGLRPSLRAADCVLQVIAAKGPAA